MKKSTTTIVTISLLFLFAFFALPNKPVGAEEDTLKTGLEIRSDGSWTTHQEELDFLKELSEISDLVEYEVYGESAEGRPMHLVKVGFSADKSNEEIAAGRTILIVGTFHGNEPSGREMALQTMRDLAFTDDPAMIELMEKSTILFLPTVNPDGREANRRRNGDNYDINRDAVRLITPEGQTLAKIQNDFQPDLILDAHERMGGPNLSVLGNKNRMVDPAIIELNDAVIADYMFKDLGDAGFEYAYYPSSDASLPTNTRTSSGFRHSIGILTEGSWLDEPLDRVDAQLISVQAILRFYQEQFDEVGKAVEQSRINHQQIGADAVEPFYLEGSVDIDVESIDDLAIIDPPPRGYVINEEQKGRIETQIKLFSIQLEEIEGGYFVTMDQEMMAIIPYIMDENARTKLINGERVMDDTHPEDLVAPSEPVAETYVTHFSELEPGAPPEGWTQLWGGSQWTVQDEPARLEHVVTEGEDRRLLVWDKVGEVHGDVEVATLVRTDQEGELFQVHLNAYGIASSNDSYYLDVKSQNGVSEIQISRVLGSLYRSLDQQTLDFDIDVDTWYQIVFQREGQTLRGKVWEYGQDEPDEWQVEVAEDVYIEFGNVGVGHETNGVINDWKHFSVGTYGAKAERAPSNILDGIDKSILERRISQIEAEGLEEDVHLVDSWTKFQMALENGKLVLADEDATQSQVDDAVKQLYDAYTSLSAQYSTDFSENEVGSSPDDWTTLWRESNWKIKDEPRRLEHSPAESSGRRVMTWDKPGTITGDVEIYTVVRKTNTSSGVLFQLHLQATGIAGTESSYYVDVTNAGKIRVNRNRNGGFSVLKSESIPSPVELDVWYEIVFKREGNTLLGKAWRYGEEEPADWQVVAEEDSFFNGKVGIGHVTNDVINDFAYFSVGTADAEAPRAPENLIIDTAPLEAKILEINELGLVEANYTAESWANLAGSLGRATAMLNETEGLTQAAILDMVIELESAILALQTMDRQYQTDFSDYEVGTSPDGWSTLWRESGWTIRDGPSRLEHFVTEGGGRRVLTSDDVGEVSGDIEVAAVVKAIDVTASTLFQLHLHGTGEAGTDTSYYLDLRTTNSVRINRNRNGGFSSLASASLPFTVEQDVWYQVVFKYEGSTLKAKAWPYGEDEPEDWQVEVVDESFSSGKVGVGHVSSGVTNEWAFFSVGINEQEAPRAPADLFEDNEPVIDKTDLQSRVDELNDLDASLYTDASWTVFEAAITHAAEVLANEDATQEEVDEALGALNSAYEGLEEIETPPVDEVDKTALQEVVDRIMAEGLEESLYTEVSWTSFETALEHAEGVLEAEDATQVEVDQALEALNTAYMQLELIDSPPVEEVNKTLLQGMVDQIATEDLDELLYTEESWMIFATALATAEEVLINEDATQEEVNQAYVDLNTAYINLELIDDSPVEEVNKTLLQGVVNHITSEDLDKSLYTEESWSIFAEALAAAEEVLANEEATQEEVDQALEALNTAYTGLEKNETPPVEEVDKTKLQEVVDHIKGEDLDSSLYTAASWAVFEATLNHAEEVLANEEITQEAVDQALEALQTAYDRLEEVEIPPVEEVDKTALQEVVNQINSEDLDGSNYTTESWNAFEAALHYAGEVLDSEEATQDDIDQALAQLNSAYGGLVKVETPPIEKVDKSALQEAILHIEAEKLDASMYTDSSWAILESAIQQAKSVLDNADATDENVKNSLEVLLEARAGLVKVPVDDEVIEEERKTEPKDDSKEQEEQALPRTATPIYNMMLIGTILIALGIGTSIIVRRRRI